MRPPYTHLAAPITMMSSSSAATAAASSASVPASSSAAPPMILQANRDPESNWEVDVAKSLEEYLLKICSGEVSGEDGARSVNFAEGTVVRRAGVSCGQRAALLFSCCVICRGL